MEDPTPLPPRQMLVRSVATAQTLGLLLGLGAWAALIAGSFLSGRAVPWDSVGYNLPLTVIFLAFIMGEAQRVRLLRLRQYAVSQTATLVTWSLGLVLLYLRVVTKDVEVSGHVVWCCILMTHGYRSGAPAWLMLLTMGVTLQVLFLKAFVLGGMSGLYGLIAGGVLSAVYLMLDLRFRARSA